MFGAVLNRLATSVRRAISDYAAGGINPPFVADFYNNKYISNNTTKTFSSAITHVRNGNATMTDGYGPELVTNGGFDGSIDGWTAEANSDVSYDDGKIRLTVANSANAGAYQELTTESGKTYIVTALLVDVDSHSFATVRVGTSGGAGNLLTSSVAEGAIQLSFTATSSTSYITLRPNSTTNGNYAVYDSVSVREMPVIKWAPHNLLTYSEDLTSWPNFGSSGTRTANYGEAPDGTATADRVVLSASGATFVSNNHDVKEGASYTFAVWVKATSTDSSFDLFSDISGSNTQLGTQTATSEWQLFTYTLTATATQSRTTGINNGNDSYASDILVWGAHVYRSDLGGMVDNPERGDSYVPTTSAAKYLPRIGHHVFNGNAFVNEGVLAESESRTNLYDNNDLMHNNGTQNSTLSANGGIAPDGTDDAVKLLETTATSEHTVLMAQSVITTGKTYTCSVFVKSIGGRNAKFGFTAVNFPSAVRINFDLENVTTASPSESTIQEIGNGWYRLSVTATSDATGTRGNTNAILQSLDGTTSSYAGDTSKGLLFYGMQIEEGATPSSYIPTANTTTVTRAAESFTIPSANLPWPTPQYIGSELFAGATYLGNGWTDNGDGTYTSDGSDLGGTGRLNIVNSTTAGTVYYLTMDVSASSIDVRQGGSNTYSNLTTVAVPIVGDSGGGNINITANGALTVSNISLREINPLSVSIGMEGAITYADEGIFATSIPQRWFDSATNKINWELSTNSTDTGKMFWIQNDGTQAARNSGDVLSPDVLVPFNMASRHGSTFINGASDGVTATVNTTPTSLPDLSSADLNLAYDYMGTIGTFRVWDRDIGDAGLVEATNPSLEPSLSLTFEGTGTNSFVVNDWSQ